MKRKMFFTFFICLAIFCFNFDINVFSTEDKPTCINDIYQIETPSDLKWFADYVNSGNTEVKAIMCNNIDLSEICSEDKESWTPIGFDYSNTFKGIFDGGNFEISGLYINTSELFCGLFGYLSGTVQNLSVRGKIIGTGDHSYCGGIAGYNYSGNIISCSFNGEIQCSSLSCGGLTAYCDMNAVIKYSYSVLTGTQYPACGENCGRIKDCFYLSETSEKKNDCTGAVKEAFSEGEICCLMNEKQSETVWKQEIGKDDFPVLSGNSIVYKTVRCTSDSNFIYRNYSGPAHNFIGNHCTDCNIKRIETASVQALLNDAVNLKYYINLNDMEISSPEIILEYGSGKSVKCVYEENGQYSAEIPKYINTLCDIDVTSVKCYSDGKLICVEDSFKYSIINYIEALMKDTEQCTDSCRSLLISLLELSAAAEKYSFGSSNLNDLLSGESWSEYTESYRISDYDAKYQNLSHYKKEISNPSANIAYAYVTVDSKINMNFYIKTEINNLQLNVKNANSDHEFNIPLKKCENNEMYIAEMRNIDAENLMDDYILSVIDENGNNVSGSIGYNLEKYVYTVENSAYGFDEETAKLCKALLNYAYNAKNYIPM